jgi:hypothetical protein
MAIAWEIVWQNLFRELTKVDPAIGETVPVTAAMAHICRHSPGEVEILSEVPMLRVFGSRCPGGEGCRAYLLSRAILENDEAYGVAWQSSEWERLARAFYEHSRKLEKALEDIRGALEKVGHYGAEVHDKAARGNLLHAHPDLCDRPSKLLRGNGQCLARRPSARSVSRRWR